jgi:hypothetical protein
VLQPRDVLQKREETGSTSLVPQVGFSQSSILQRFLAGERLAVRQRRRTRRSARPSGTGTALASGPLRRPQGSQGGWEALPWLFGVTEAPRGLRRPFWMRSLLAPTWPLVDVEATGLRATGRESSEQQPDCAG